MHSLDAIYNQSVVLGRMVFVLIDEGEVFVPLSLVAEEVVELCDVFVELQARLALSTVFCLLDGYTFKVVAEGLLVLVKTIVCQSHL